MRTVWPLLLLGCSPLLDPGERPQPIIAPDVGFDAEPAPSAPPNDDAGSQPVDAASFVADAAPPSCMPGERVGLCALCGRDGVVSAPADDPACPSVCEPEHRLGPTGCERAEVLAERRCAAPGECRRLANDACELGAYSLVQPAEECARIEGCAGPEPPRVVAQAGAPCHRFGLCGEDGRCDVPAECAFPGPVELCGWNDEEPEIVCVFATSVEVVTDCATVCSAGGGVCVHAALDFEGCVDDEPIPCDAADVALVCFCAVNR